MTTGKVVYAEKAKRQMRVSGYHVYLQKKSVEKRQKNVNCEKCNKKQLIFLGNC